MTYGSNVRKEEKQCSLIISIFLEVSENNCIEISFKQYEPFGFPCADPEIFMRGGPTKMVTFGHRRGGGPTPKKSRNYVF